MFFSKRIFGAGAAVVAAIVSANIVLAADYADYGNTNNYDSNGNYANDVVVPSENKPHFWSGNWSLTLGATGASGPSYEGDGKNEFKFSPVISLGRTGATTRFSSRNDNPSFALISTANFNAGIVGKVLWQRDDSTSDDLKGLKRIKWGAEAGIFAEFFPIDGLRIRSEVRQGFRSHNGVAADIAVDAYQDITPTVRISGGPRMFIATDDYFDAYYGVSANEARHSGLKKYKPGGGVGSVGVGGAINWKVTDKITTGLFGEYDRLTGPAADSSLVKQRGSKNQFTIGIMATYRFDFTLP